MRRVIPLCFLFLLCGWISYAQNRPTATKPQFSLTEKNDRFFRLLLIGGNEIEEKEAIFAIEQNPNNFSPPVLFVLSAELFDRSQIKRAMFWHLVAEIRTKYAINLSIPVMKPAGKRIGALLAWEFSNPFAKYAFSDSERLGKIIADAVGFVRANKANYPHAWLYLNGRKRFSKAEALSLLVPEEKWADVKRRTLLKIERRVEKHERLARD